MDTVHELAEQSSEEMREEIDSTRSDLAHKLVALEDSVMGTVQSAQATVEDSIQIAKDTVAAVKRTFDLKHHVEQRPWTMLGTCCLTGLAAGALFQRVWRRPRPTALPARPAVHAGQHGGGTFATTAVPPYPPSPPSRPGLFDLFHDEIAKVKGMAIACVMGRAREAIKGAGRQWGPRIDGVMSSATRKRGGEPAPQQAT